MTQKTKFFEAELVLGQCIELARRRAGLNRKQLGQLINENEQQITKYETGGFVPLTKIEDIAIALDSPIQKKYIRRVSFLRKLEMETGTEQTELCELYRSLFED